MEGGSCQAVLGIATYLTNGSQDNSGGEINLFRVFSLLFYVCFC